MHVFCFCPVNSFRIAKPPMAPTSDSKGEQLVQKNLPFGGEKGKSIIKKLRRNIEKTAQNRMKHGLLYT